MSAAGTEADSREALEHRRSGGRRPDAPKEPETRRDGNEGSRRSVFDRATCADPHDRGYERGSILRPGNRRGEVSDRLEASRG